MMRAWLLVLVGCQGTPDAPPKKIAPKPVIVDAAIDPNANVLPAEAIGTGEVYGTKHRVVRAKVDPKGRWVLACQQRKDTDGDGAITYALEAHFALGDDPEAFFAIGGGPGAKVDSVIAIAPSGDHLVLGLGDGAILVDVAAKTAIALPGASAHSSASFTRDGAFVDYTGDGTLVHRAIATTKSVTWPVEHVRGMRSTGRWVAIADEAARSIAPFAGWCDLSGGNYDEPALRWLDTTTGKILEDKTILRPIGDHRLARFDDKTLALDGQRIDSNDCIRVAAIGVYEPTEGVVLRCDHAQRQSEYEYVVPGKPRVTLEGYLERFDSSVPSLDPKFCLLNRCIDLAAGTIVEGAVEQAPNSDWWTFGFVGDRYLGTDQRSRGPLRWREANPPIAVYDCKVPAIAKRLDGALPDLERCVRNTASGFVDVDFVVAKGKVKEVVAAGLGYAGAEDCVKRKLEEEPKIVAPDGDNRCRLAVGRQGGVSAFPRVSVNDYDHVIDFDAKKPPVKPKDATEKTKILIVADGKVSSAEVDALVSAFKPATIHFATEDPNGLEPMSMAP